jgi:hypothetical protein
MSIVHAAQMHRVWPPRRAAGWAWKVRSARFFRRNQSLLDSYPLFEGLYNRGLENAYCTQS